MKDADYYNLEINEKIPIIRFDGRLYFASVPYFEDEVLNLLNEFPEAEYLVVSGAGINAIDSTGEEMLYELHETLKDIGIYLAFSGLKEQILEVFEHSGLMETIGEDYLFLTEKEAVQCLEERMKNE